MPCVYAHFRKDNDAPFYVGAGKTSSRAHNFWHHSRTDQHKQIRKDYGAYASVIEDFEDQKIAYFWEQRWIKALRSEGYELVNLTDGGAGPLGRKHSPETIAKMKQGRNTPEARARSALGRLGKAPSNKGKTASDEQKEKLRKAWVERKKRPISDELREKGRIAAMKRWHPQERI